MKKAIIIALALAVITGAGIKNALAASTGSTSLKSGTMGFNVGMGNSILGDLGVITISGKYFILDDLAVLAGIGVQDSSGDFDERFFSISAGLRHYFNTNDFSPFVEGRFSYEDENTTVTGDRTDQNAFDFSAIFGAEYFLSKQFSVEGAVGFGFGTITIKTPGLPDQDSTYFGTRTVGVSANFYF
jgi:hypothetical protein